MRFLSIVSLTALFTIGQAATLAPKTPSFVNATIYNPPAGSQTSYARSTFLEVGNTKVIPPVLTTYAGGDHFVIYRSNDGGKSWKSISKAYFTNGNYTGGIILRPFLYELPEDLGEVSAGTVFLSGNAIPGDFSSTNIELYASTDKGRSWSFVSVVAVGGPPNTDNGAPCVWEPFILLHESQLAVYYSDQRDPKHDQKLCHQISTDALSWGPVINDVAYANYTLRPGKITMAQIGNGQWMCSFELALAVDVPYAVHYKLADSPFDFLKAKPIEMKASNTGTIPAAGPFITWPAAGGPDGTIVVSDSSYNQLFINKKNADPDSWIEVASGHGVGYTRSLYVVPGYGEKLVLLFNGGMYGEIDTLVSDGTFTMPGPPAS
ncbi:hypothetical protein LTR09_001521 [Extremus antarcticus]|uniref:Glycoside hydrolase family 93 protein n=1 Tax=Extremus antarcticus TaxID=702011 RepID=A0AAJ0GGX0_9PEZI|nr:hypothetical protein LTR09_001521 [Extremus antarcticus]